MTYIEIKDGEPIDFFDGFYCGNCANHFLKDQRGLKEHLEILWDDDHDRKSKKSKYCQKQWKKLFDEYHSKKKMKDGIRIGFFEQDAKEVVNIMKQFEKNLAEIGYKIDGNLANIVERKK
jgi:hypothetical protein